MTKRIGFACKLIDRADQVNGIKATDDCKKYNTGTTTVAWLSRQPASRADDKLWSLMKQNIEATRKLVAKVSTFDTELKMVRISSDLLPVYTHPEYASFYLQPSVQQYMSQKFQQIGDIARDNDVRLSFHPGQFCCLASDNPDVISRSIEEFEYHVDMAKFMGYAKTFQDIKINVHIAGRLGPSEFLKSYNKLSPEARNVITIENEEITHGLDACLSISNIIPVVLDIHHNFIKTGEYIQANDPRIKTILDSWRGQRPVMHYSVSRESVLPNHCKNTLPDLQLLLESGHNKSTLRAHSDFYWNNAVNTWALSFWDQFDIMCESKAKNLASFKLYELSKQLA